MTPQYEEEAKRILLRVIDACSGCRTPYEAEDVEIISRNGDMWFFALSCSHCQSRAMVAAAISQDWETDVLQADTTVTSFEHGEPVSSNDVEAIREFLEDFDGDFKRLFGKSN